MKTLSKEKVVTKKETINNKPEGLPKITLGIGRNLAFISDNLFEESLRR